MNVNGKSYLRKNGWVLSKILPTLIEGSAFTTKVIPRDERGRLLGWFGVVIGAAGLASVIPPLHDASIIFGMLLIAWFAWIGATLMTTKASGAEPSRATRARAAQVERGEAGLGSATGGPDLA